MRGTDPIKSTWVYPKLIFVNLSSPLLLALSCLALLCFAKHRKASHGMERMMIIKYTIFCVFSLVCYLV
jgi:hypothetical protein